MNNLSGFANNSTLTQRKSHLHCKGIFIDKQNNQNIKSSNKKLTKAISALKTDRKAEYTKLKAKQFQSELNKKQTQKVKSGKKSKKEAIEAIDSNRTGIEEHNKIYFGNDKTIPNNILSEITHQKAQIKKSSDEILISEIQKNQKQFIQKISLLEQQNYSLSHKNKNEISQMKLGYEDEIKSLKEEIKCLSSRLNQNNTRNTSMEQKLACNQKQFLTLREKLHEKDLRISFLENQNQQLHDQLKMAKNSIYADKTYFDSLQKNISDLRAQKLSLHQQISKAEKEKKQIKQNCIQVLALLREQFGDQLKVFL